MCKDCSTRTGGECRFHQQSPIHLERSITAKRECKDRHRMGIVEGNCKFGTMDFQVLSHVLRAYQPEYCEEESNIDFSWEFPDPWMLKFTDIVVPSHHAQDGKQYAAEVILSHVLSKDMHDRLVSRKAKQTHSVLSSNRNTQNCDLCSCCRLPMSPYSSTSGQKKRIITTFWSCTFEGGMRN